MEDNTHVQIRSIHPKDRHHSEWRTLVGLKGHVQGVTEWLDWPEMLDEESVPEGFYSCLFIPDNLNLIHPSRNLCFYAVELKEI